MRIVGRINGMCNEIGCTNKAYKIIRLNPTMGMWECRRHYYEHR